MRWEWSDFVEANSIFELVRSVTSRTEPFHSAMLAWFLVKDQQFCSNFIDTFVCKEFLERYGLIDSQRSIRGLNNIVIEEGLSGGKRIDILLKLESAIIGIEVKTVDNSARTEQLNEYWRSLRNEDVPVFLLYLTPFSKENLEDMQASQVAAIAAYDDFNRHYPGVSFHINWESVIDIYPEIEDKELGLLFTQHQRYVKNVICDRQMQKRISRDRGLVEFFGDDAIQAFFSALKRVEPSPQEYPDRYSFRVSDYADKPDEILRCLAPLVESEEFQWSSNSSRANRLPEGLLQTYLNGEFGPFIGVFLTSLQVTTISGSREKAPLECDQRTPNFAVVV